MKLSFGFSTCPNDTYMFEALVNKRILNNGLEFNVLLTDVEELNRKALSAELDISKISIAAYPHFAHNYQLLTSGSAIGKGNGPVLVSRRKIYPDELPEARIAIPGIYTTARLLLGIIYPEAKQTREYLFSDIEEAVISNEADAGVIIHENRFTYQAKGLRMISDLGEEWEKITHMPLPLGGIVIRRNLGEPLKIKINQILASSIRFASDNPLVSLPFVKKHARNLDDSIIFQHIHLFVNSYSVQMGEEGKEAIKTLFGKGHDTGSLPEINEPIFAE